MRPASQCGKRRPLALPERSGAIEQQLERRWHRPPEALLQHVSRTRPGDQLFRQCDRRPLARLPLGLPSRRAASASASGNQPRQPRKSIQTLRAGLNGESPDEKVRPVPQRRRCSIAGGRMRPAHGSRSPQPPADSSDGADLARPVECFGLALPLRNHGMTGPDSSVASSQAGCYPISSAGLAAPRPPS